MKAARKGKSARRFSSNIIPVLIGITDVSCLLISLPIALLAQGLLIGAPIDPGIHGAAAAIALIVFLLIRQSRGAYFHTINSVLESDAGVVIDYVISALLSLVIIWQFNQLSMFSRGLTLIYIFAAVFTLFISRLWLRALLRRLLASGRIRQRAVLYGADFETVERIRRLLELQALPQLLLLGVADDRAGVTHDPDMPFIGGIAEVLELARDGELDQVLLALSNTSRERLDDLLEKLSSVAVDVSLIPQEAITLFPDYKVRFLGEVPALMLWERPFRDLNNVAKDIEDFFFASVALIALMPLMLITALIIKLTSRGPILFVQPRFGFNNNEILVYKFRSMYFDKQDISGAERTRKNDSRITPFGKFIRALSIDELPQLFNVLRGDMSIVGPRPHATHMKVGERYYFDAVSGYAARHRVKPGLTGLAQVRGLRGEIQTIERAKRRVELDIYYIEHWSLGLDLRIMLETVVKVLVDRDAY